jgi:peroxidase
MNNRNHLSERIRTQYRGRIVSAQRGMAYGGIGMCLAIGIAACTEMSIPLAADPNATLNLATLLVTEGESSEPQENQRRSSMVQRNRTPGRGNAPGAGPPPNPNQPAARFPQEIRTIDGLGNNTERPEWGSSGVPFLRLAGNDYADGLSVPSGATRLSPREISNLCAAQETSIPNNQNASDYVWQWGQFLDHDIDETPVAAPAEEFDIRVPAGDPYFDPNSTGTQTISLDRSSYETINGVRQQVNEITAFIDASNVYGSDDERADALRTFDGTGRLRTSAGGLLPFNDLGLENAPANSPNFFLAGDIRANEQVGLTAMHTLFVREHNFWADEFATSRPDANGDDLYEFARAIVIAEMQAITVREFLPVLLGPDPLPPYQGYRSDLNPGIANCFATASYRVGHSMLSEMLLRLDRNGSEIDAGHLALSEAFFNPQWIIADGIAPVLRGLAAQPAQAVDTYVIDAVRNFLFGQPGAGGFDLPALNIQRGRDHGIPDLNSLRRAYGLQPYTTFAEINPDPQVIENLSLAYAGVDEIDAWVGGLAEPPVRGGMVGQTWSAILRDQFTRLRDGDRFWYAVYLPPELRDLVEAQTLDRIIRRNTPIGNELPSDVFHVGTIQPGLNEIEPVLTIDLATVLFETGL